MAVLINCCLNISPPPSSSSSSSSSSPLKANRISLQRKEDSSGSWRNQVIVGVACMIIGFDQIVPLVVNSSDCCALAEELKFISNIADQGGERWSDKRMCPPWMMNSLETIIPENLPRPSAHRKFESISLSSTAPTWNRASTVVKAVKSNCFSL